MCVCWYVSVCTDACVDGCGHGCVRLPSARHLYFASLLIFTVIVVFLVFLQLPTASVWMEVCQQMHAFLFDKTPEGRAQTALNTLRSLLDPDLRFSERFVALP